MFIFFPKYLSVWNEDSSILLIHIEILPMECPKFFAEGTCQLFITCGGSSNLIRHRADNNKTSLPVNALLGNIFD